MTDVLIPRFFASFGATVISGTILGIAVYHFKEQRLRDEDSDEAEAAFYDQITAEIDETVVKILAQQLATVLTLNSIVEKACNLDLATICQSPGNFRKYAPIVALHTAKTVVIHSAHSRSYADNNGKHHEEHQAAVKAESVIDPMMELYTIIFLRWHRLSHKQQARYLHQSGRHQILRMVLLMEPSTLGLIAVVVPTKVAIYEMIGMPCSRETFLEIVELYASFLRGTDQGLYIPTTEDVLVVFDAIDKELAASMQDNEKA